MEEFVFPECHKCSTGVLVPLSDYGRDGATIMYKAWVCTNPECGFTIRIDNGDVSYGKTTEDERRRHRHEKRNFTI